MRKIVSVIFVFALLVLGLSSCFFASTPSIDFIVDGEVYATAKTDEIGDIALPASPTKEGYDFDGWYWDDGYWNMTFDGEAIPVSKLSDDMRVYAKWNVHTHTPSDWIIDKKATCEAEGLKHNECLKCGETLETVTIGKHTPVTDKGTKPSYTAGGFTDGEYCYVCGETLVPKEVIPVLTPTPELLQLINVINSSDPDVILTEAKMQFGNLKTLTEFYSTLDSGDESRFEYCYDVFTTEDTSSDESTATREGIVYVKDGLYSTDKKVWTPSRPEVMDRQIDIELDYECIVDYEIYSDGLGISMTLTPQQAEKMLGILFDADGNGIFVDIESHENLLKFVIVRYTTPYGAKAEILTTYQYTDTAK